MSDPATPPPPLVRLSIGITGHRAGHASYAENAAPIAAALDSLFDAIDRFVAATPCAFSGAAVAPTRLHSLLANGTDQVAASLALARGWELVAPLPFGEPLNEAINSLPQTEADARALIGGGEAEDPRTAAQAAAIRSLADRAQLFEMADRDAEIAELLLDKLAHPQDFASAQLYAAETSVRLALAGRILIEQSDIVIGVWDGATTAHVGGTGHTIAAALEMGAPVIWVNPYCPEKWRVLRAPEALANLDAGRTGDQAAAVAALVRDALHPGEDADHPGVAAIQRERWHSASPRLSHAYRRVEALFGGPASPSGLRSMRQVYENPETVASGSGAAVLAATGAITNADPAFPQKIEVGVLRRFVWADGVSTWLSDSYRGGMVINFILSSLAIVGGLAYLPVTSPHQKWVFALFELILLLTILFITWRGQRKRWHGRWFETRRAAEYLRHAPLLLILGAARAPGRWPKGTETSWPEFYVRHALRDVGLPQARVTSGYLRGVLSGLLDRHVTEQRDYHFAKAARLTHVHRALDRWSTILFVLAVVSVTLYLALRAGAALGVLETETVDGLAKLFTMLGVMFPTFGAGISGIRYFGDFERFAAISEITAEKLDLVHARIVLLAKAPDAEIHYGRVAALAHETDDIVFAEIENWQAVFGGKQITIPV